MHLRCSLTPDPIKLGLYVKVNVTLWGTVVLCKLVQGGLGRWVCLEAVSGPQKLWCEGRTLIDSVVANLDYVRDREGADHVH